MIWKDQNTKLDKDIKTFRSVMKEKHKSLNFQRFGCIIVWFLPFFSISFCEYNKQFKKFFSKVVEFWMISMDTSWLRPCFARHYLQFKPRYPLRIVVSHDLSIKIYQNLTKICSFKCLIHNIKNLWNSLEKVLIKTIQRK